MEGERRRTKIVATMGPASSSLEMSVRDSGEGIEPDFLPHVFDQFR